VLLHKIKHLLVYKMY